ncbi:YkgJ family cysteine cluster protein [Archaeoglobus neptunius]|uniref:YkgJ family cysteine cluster protein n=1 Tax=Archaeoglobus neptunius TaxID=2798580 RepID=UPI00192872E9|nr:YkgJ family cysteine cluster protein [Archaeoglobus neptunius]
MNQELEPVDKFRFSCYPGISCFNECCQNLNIALTPYDVLRMARGLGVTTTGFLEKYTEMHIGPATGLPVVVLKMSGKCPFVSEKGCAIYSHRPTACRLYPLARVRVGDQIQYYLVREEFCKGHEESMEWHVGEWVRDQGAEEYNSMNDIFFQLITAKNRVCRSLSRDEIRKIYESCFDIDSFRARTGIRDDLEALMEGIRFSISLLLD